MLTVLGDPYTFDDCLGTLGAIGPWWNQLLDGREIGSAQPAVRAGLEATAGALDELLVRLGRDGSPPAIDVAGVWARGDRARAAAVKAARTPALDAQLHDTLSTALGAVQDASDALRQAGALPATATGEVREVHTSAGGVPKLPVDDATIDAGGLVGDVQATRRHHGRPWQAVCLWSAEVIDDFAAQGHPIAYGSCGENLTLAGIPWADVRSGVRLRVGDALLEASVFALPCSNNARWFRDGDFNHMHHERGPVSRIYASVIEGGAVRPGDAAVLEPAARF
jgi:MOSC domain-containing protein YiiM